MPLVLTSLPMTAEPEAMIEPDNPGSPGTGRKRVKSLFSKHAALSSKDKGPNTVSQVDETLLPPADVICHSASIGGHTERRVNFFTL